MNKLKHEVGIVSYGAYIPRFRIKTEEIAKVWGANPESIKNGLGITEKSVPGKDEDTITISTNVAIQLASRYLNYTNQEHLNLGAIYVGSESHPYAVKPTSTIVGETLGFGNNYTCADLEFACKAGTAAIQICTGLVGAGLAELGLAIGADTAQGAPGDALEYSAACGGAGFLIGNKHILARLLHTTSFTSDTPDFWRREHESYPKHGGRFTGEPAYFKHVGEAIKQFLKESGTEIKNYDHVVLHMPNGKFPKALAQKLKISEQQLAAGFVVSQIGNTYSGCSMIGLASILDVAKPQEKILMASYGSGAGSDVFGFEVTKNILSYRKHQTQTVKQQIENEKIYLNYGEYITHTNKLKR